MYRLLSPLMLALCLSGCSTSPSNCNPICYQKTKPNIAFVPIKEDVEVACTWDLGRELTDKTLATLMDKNSVYVTPYIQFKPALEFTQECDYFGSDLNFANSFSQSDFLVVSEILSHDIVAYSRDKFPEIEPRRSYGPFEVLVLGTRVRVIDLRFEHPKVVLQKFVETYEIVSASEKQIDYSLIDPSHEKYASTPFARSHKKIATELANEIEESIASNW